MSYRLHPTKNRSLPPDAVKKWYYIEGYPLGKKGGLQRTLAFGTEASIAEQDRQLRQQFRKVQTTVNPQFHSITEDFLEWYKVEHLPRSVESAELHIRHLSTLFHLLPLTAIPGLIEGYKAKKLAEGLAPITINKHLNTLSMIFQFAVEKEMIAEVPSIKRFPPKKTRSPVPILPTYEDMEAVVNEVREEVRGIVMLEFYAGLRRTEAATLTAENVLLQRRLLIVRGKGDKQRIVPIGDKLYDMLKEKLEKVKSGYLWINHTTGRPFKDIGDSIKNAANRRKLDGRWYQHLFRHGFATTCIESGMGSKTVQAMMGHVSERTLDIYTHLAAKHLLAEMDKWRDGKAPDDGA